MQKTVALLLSLILITTHIHSQTLRTTSKVGSTLLRGPFLQAATPNSIVIRWRTDVLSRGIVHFGKTLEKLDRNAQDTVLVTEHKIKLDNLEPNTKYFYTIGSYRDSLQGGPNNYFFTLPTPGTEALYRIAAVGDCGNNSVNQRSVRDALIKYIGDNYLNAWILLGDNAYSTGRDAEFQSNFFNVYKETLLPKYPLYPSPGNHDYYDGDSSEQKVQQTHQVAYFQNFTMPSEGEAGGVPSHNPAFYSYDLGNIHFLSLDSYGIEEERYRMYDTLGPQVQWVKKDLEAYGHKGWVIAYWHHPPYTMGSHNSDHETELIHIRENFIQILERYGVDLIICGHSHDYERSQLIKGHYGMEPTFNPSFLVNSFTGLYDGTSNSCPYLKDSTTGYTGTVYIVSGSAGQLGGKQAAFPHDALPYSDATHGGAGMLEIQGNRLDWKWVCSDGEIRDHFTLFKNVNKRHIITAKKGETITLTAPFPSDKPYQWSTKATTRSIDVKASNKVYTVKDANGCIQDSFEVKTK
ncbi:MAG: metallophosphoesterase family protein [Bacteroidetes bacterium]|nr:metallophosphoesterase family protein [Bacteroidota bacterium]